MAAGGLVAAGAVGSLFRGRRRNAALSAALVAIVLAGVRVAPEWAARLAPMARAEGEQLKVVQFNAYVENVSPARSVDWLLAQDADILVIEEGEGLPRDQVLRLRARYPYCNGCPDEGNWSNMILARRPAVAEGRFERPRPDTNFPILGGWSRFAGHGGDYTVVGVHLTWPWKWGGPRQREALAEFIGRAPSDRTLLLGDFNMAPWSTGLRRFDRTLDLRRLTHGQASWPGQSYYRLPWAPRPPFPLLPIDQVYAGEGWKAVSVKRGPNIGSDHYPIVVELAAVAPPRP